MLVPRFVDLKIQTKLIAVTLVVVLLPLMTVAFLATNRFGGALTHCAGQDLEHLVGNLHSMCRIQDELIQSKVASNLKVAHAMLYRGGNDIEILQDVQVPFEAIDQATQQVLQVTVPLWRIRGEQLTADFRLVDEIQELVGGIITIFQRIEGNRLLRTATNVFDREGKRAIGTLISAGSSVTQTILSGQDFRGRAQVADKWYITAYEPLKTTDGQVIGALCAGVEERSVQSLRNVIKGIRVGETGYAYVIDSLGNLKIHPAKEGEKILDSQDSSGSRYIQAMIGKALRLADGEVGTIRYPWVNPELGEKQPRFKINKYVHFKPWDWIISAGSYEEEIYRALHQTGRFIFLIVLSAVAAVIILILSFSKALTHPIRDLTEATTKMVHGDLSQRVIVRGGDEIGVLGTSFNRLIAQIQNYTSDLEKAVQSRTQELEDSREKHRAMSRFLNTILDSATEYSIMALDLDGQVIEFNRGAEKLFGWKKEEVIKKKNIDVTILPEDRAKGIQQETFNRAREESVSDLEMLRLRKDSSVFPAHTTLTVILDQAGQVVGFVEISRNITQRKMLEKTLRETKDFLENIMESSVDAIITTDLKGHITYVNLATEEILGYHRHELLGQHTSILYTRGLEEARDIMRLLKAVERTENYEMEMRKKDGEIIQITTSLFLLQDEERQLVGTAGIFKDVTERKRLETKLKATQAQLVEASKMRALGELVAGVAHELNNPLMASKAVLYVIRRNLPPGTPERERLELIEKCNERIEKIVEHLREFSRQTQPVFEELDVNLPIENALLITGQQLLSHNISVIKKLGPDLPKVVGDINQLEQVFLNLISNARDAMEEVTARKELTISSCALIEDGKPMLAVSISDTGAGISPQNLDKVFEPFFTTKRVGKGTGLGLSLCFGIIEAHNGLIRIRSEEGRGTDVTVLLPVSKAGKE